MSGSISNRIKEILENQRINREAAKYEKLKKSKDKAEQDKHKRLEHKLAVEKKAFGRNLTPDERISYDKFEQEQQKTKAERKQKIKSRFQELGERASRLSSSVDTVLNDKFERLPDSGFSYGSVDVADKPKKGKKDPVMEMFALGASQPIKKKGKKKKVDGLEYYFGIK